MVYACKKADGENYTTQTKFLNVVPLAEQTKPTFDKAHALIHVHCRYDDGGMLKITYSTAFTVSLLSWAFSQFKEGYRASGNLELGANTVRCAPGGLWAL